MGTSAGYEMPTGGEWTDLKRDATRYADSDKPDQGDARAASLLGNYASTFQGGAGAGGSSGGTGGQGAAGSGGSSGGSSSSSAGRASAIRVGTGLGGFLSTVGNAGLPQALQDIGLGHMVGKTAAEIAAALVDALAGPASTIDDYAAKKACDDLRKELLADAKTAEDVEKALKASLDVQGLGGILMRYFSLYIFRCFCRDFYERWIKRVGSAKTSVKLSAIKKYVDTRLKAKMVNKDVSAVNWKGKDGAQIVSQIMSDTCKVFKIDGGASTA